MAERLAELSICNDCGDEIGKIRDALLKQLEDTHTAVLEAGQTNIQFSIPRGDALQEAPRFTVYRQQLDVPVAIAAASSNATPTQKRLSALPTPPPSTIRTSMITPTPTPDNQPQPSASPVRGRRRTRHASPDNMRPARKRIIASPSSGTRSKISVASKRKRDLPRRIQLDVDAVAGHEQAAAIADQENERVAAVDENSQEDSNAEEGVGVEQAANQSEDVQKENTQTIQTQHPTSKLSLAKIMKCFGLVALVVVVVVGLLIAVCVLAQLELEND